MHIIKQKIISKLTEQLNPTYLEVIDESYLHANHNAMAKNGGTHFKVQIEAEELNKLSRVEAHRKINHILANELANGVHALSIELL